MEINVSLPTANIDYSGYDDLPNKVKITDFQLQAYYYKRFYMTMSHGPMFDGLFNAFRRVINLELENQ
jgi:hypothetical protein